MNIQNVKPVTKCPRCMGEGFVIAPRENLVMLECEECAHMWLTHSKICPDCKEANGYFVDGPCRPCYSVRRQSL